ncbi:MAG: alpha/beta hydrolase [Bacteroides sp.]|jgi:pimeloyl-ACP methyl ester carboxylesterase|nr:alpha/beta hydrolase [Bacteroides sp.]
MIYIKNLTRFLFFLLILLQVTACTTYRYRRLPNKEIQQFEMVRIGGVKQAISIRGDNRQNPVLVYLHGGPGYPLFPFEPQQESMLRLEGHFTLVYWEQRGTGKSFSQHIPRKSMNIEQFVDDTREVVEYARKVTGAEKVLLWGHSWGSNVGALFASRYPELLHAYISTGQSVSPFENEQLAYEFVLEKAREEGNQRALRQLARIDTLEANYSLKHALTVRRWVFKYGGIVKKGSDRPYVDINEIGQILSAPEYSITDRINLIRFPYFSAEELWEDLKAFDLREAAPRIDVPVFFLVGKYDRIVSAQLAREYFEMLEAPQGKHLILFEHSAHRPFDEEREIFLEVLKGKILTDVFGDQAGIPE